MKVNFQGRVRGAIGIMEWFTIQVPNDPLKSARLKLYSRYDHIMWLKQIYEPVQIRKIYYV